MKQLIIAIAFLISFAQAQDSAKIGLPLDRKGSARKITAAELKGRAIDSVKIMKIGSDTLERIFTGDWIMSYGGIYANGSDVTNRVQAMFNRNYISEIGFKDDSIRVITINGNVDAKNIIGKFNGSIRIQGTGTISNLIIDAVADIQIFAPTINLINVRSKDGYFYPKWYGVKGDGVTDDLIGMRKTLTLPGKNRIKFTTGNYLLSDTVWCENNDIDMGSGSDARLLINHNKIGILLGSRNPALRTDDATWIVNVKKVTQSNWADSVMQSKTNLDSIKNKSIGIYMRNAYACKLTTNFNEGFTENITSIGEETGVEHCDIWMGQVRNGWITLHSYGTGVNGYFNSNRVWGGNITRIGNVNPTARSWGWVIGSNNKDTYGYNHNKWESPSFQMGANSYIFRFYSGGGNILWNIRSEGNNQMVGVFEGRTRNSEVYLGYGYNNETYIDSTNSEGGNNRLFTQADLAKGSQYTLYHWTARGNVVEYNSTNIHIGGTQVFLSGSGYNTTISPKSSVTFRGEYVDWYSQDNNIGTVINTKTVKGITVKPGYYDGSHCGRLHIKMMDANGKWIEKPPSIEAPMSRTTTYGGGYVTQSDNCGDWSFIVPANCESVQVLIITGTANLWLKELVINAKFPNNGTALTGRAGDPNKRSVAAQKPTSMGSYYLGQITYRHIPNADSSFAWECSKPGTLGGRMAGATASMANGSNKIVVSGVSLDTTGFVGEYVSLAGVTYPIAGRWGDTLYSQIARSGGNVIAQPLTYAIAEFVELGKPGSGGLSGLTAGRVPYANSSTTITDDAGLTWNNTDKRFGITSSDAAKYSSVDWTNNSGDLAQMAMLGSSFNVGYFKGRRAVFKTGSPIGMAIAAYDAAGKLFFATGGTADANVRMVINPNGSISIGDTTKGIGFHINRSLHVNRDSLTTTNTMSSKHLAVVNSTGRVEKISVGDLGIESGIYTPTVTYSGGITNAGADSVGYMRVGRSVTVWGQISYLSPNSVVNGINLTLPVLSNFPSSPGKYAAGFFEVIGGVSGIIYPEPGGSRVFMSFNQGALNNGVMQFHFSYTIY